MIQFRREALFDALPDVEPFLQKHYEELCANRQFVQLKPRWDAYAALEQAGLFRVFTARDDGALVGYSAFFTNLHLHYGDLMVAQNDALYIRQESRAGTLPMRFIRWCERELQDMGAHKIVYHCKPQNNLAPLLTRMGYQSEETMCAKLMIGV